MAALVEVHNATELDRALKLAPALIGINNRDLKTFDVSLDTTRQLAQHVPDDVILVAESGVFTAQDVQHMARAGAHAVLVGEALVRSGDIAGAVRALSTQSRSVTP
jgi:indole-3-glycerol phosphate synthase